MDNVTHALAGCLLAAGTVAVLDRRGIKVSDGFGKAAVAIGIITAELPDSDLVYAGQSLGMGKLGYLLHHRGHTHTVLFAVASAIVVWLVTLALKRQLRERPQSTALLVLALAGTLSHLLLDFTNNYGVHPFWPVTGEWFYGDAVFIVEPWLWVAVIPPLFAIYKRKVPRALLALLLLVILAAAWGVSMVGREIALALTIGTALWIFAVRALNNRQKVLAALVAWLCVEGTFFAFSQRARSLIREATGSTYVDAAITPFIGNPLCFYALVMEKDGATYRVSEATAATVSSVRAAAKCEAQSRGGVPGNTLSTRIATSSVRWIAAWSAPLTDLNRIVQTNCEVAAAMQFIRVPVWRELQNGAIEIGDIRFGSLTGGFSSITAQPSPSPCPRWVPGWTPPRQDLLTASP